MSADLIRFDHLDRLSDDIGLFEHADGFTPRVEHGYCVDDVARGLVVLAREPVADPVVTRLSTTYLHFVLAAQANDGRFHNRRNARGAWTDEPALADHWGRALWGLGSVVARVPERAEPALVAFDASVRHRSPWLRSMVFAALGAAEVLSVLPDHRQARSLLRGAALRIGDLRGAGRWNWPETRLHYANAALPEVMLAAGAMLDEPRWVHEGMSMLAWLVLKETNGDHLSVTPTGGWGPGDDRPGFDQQPIEVAALADACARAFAIDPDPLWSQTLDRCGAWFEGANDAQVPMLESTIGAGYDGLEPAGRNGNCGAESTLAMLATMQQVARMPAVRA